MKLDLLSSLKISFFYFCLQTVSSADKVFFPEDEDIPNLMDVLKVDNEIRNRQSFFNRQRDVCLHITGQPGECKPYTQCPELLNFIRINGLHNPPSVQFLRSRICSFSRNSVNLCCPQGRADSVAPPISGQQLSLPSMNQCGFTLIQKIVNGVEIAHGSHPWLVGLGSPGQNGAFRNVCGGTLVSRRHVITAAHCFVPGPGIPPITHVSLGEHSLSGTKESSVIVSISKHLNPGYNTVSQQNDIELVTLEKDVAFNTFIRPACLPTTNFRGRNLDRQFMTIVGWGDLFFGSRSGSDVPRSADITVIPKAECRTLYSSSPEIPLDATQLCAAYEGIDACQGDSGGPLLYRDFQHQGRFFLIGVVSFGIECANPKFPGVYTFIPEFMDWIKKNL